MEEHSNVTVVHLQLLRKMSSEARASGDDLAERLAVYRSQLVAVDAVLAADPLHEQYLIVRGDLIKLISLTSDLYDAQQCGNDDDQNEGDAEEVEGVAALANEAINDFDDDDDDDLSAEGIASGLISVGDAVEVRGDDRLFSAVLTAINSSEGTCAVRYFEFGTVATLPLSSVSKAAPGPFTHREQLPLGFECMCKFAADQKYYDAVVKNHSPDGIVVAYTMYGNSEEVPIEYIRARKTKKGKEALGAKPDIALLFAPKTIKVPQKFIILPTDTEEEKAKKKRGLKSIKSKNRLIEKEATLVQGQQSWQQFKNKGGKTVAKSSIFSSDKSKSVTSFAERKKHVFTSSS